MHSDRRTVFMSVKDWKSDSNTKVTTSELHVRLSSVRSS
jgi:hypothetical protein